MRFFVLSGTSHSDLCRAVRSAGISLASQSELVGTGPDCEYHYSRLIAAPDAPTDYPADALYAVAFGRGNGWKLAVREVTAQEAEDFLASGSAGCPKAPEFPSKILPCILALPGAYPTHEGGVSPGYTTPAMIRLLASA